MDHEKIYWLFSTISQTYGVFIGVVGMLVVFRFQKIKEDIIKAIEKNIDYIQLVIEKGADNFTESELCGEFLEKWDKRDKLSLKYPEKYDNQIQRIARILKENDSQRATLRTRFLAFFIFHMAILISSISGIMWDWEVLHWQPPMNLKWLVIITLLGSSFFSYNLVSALIGGGKGGLRRLFGKLKVLGVRV